MAAGEGVPGEPQLSLAQVGGQKEKEGRAAGYQAHEAWLKEERARQKQDLEIAVRKALMADTVRQMYQALRARLERATDQDRRFVLECLGTRVVVQPEGLTVELEVPESVVSTVRTSRNPWIPVSRGALSE